MSRVLVSVAAVVWLLACASTGVKATALAPQEDPDLSGWLKVGEPTGDDLWCANRSRRSWRLSLSRNGDIQASLDDELKKRRDDLPFTFSNEHETSERLARRVVHRVGSDWLVGFDLGEYGGGLWVADSSGQSRRPISSKNVREIVMVGGDVFALAGQPHLERGAVLKITRDATGQLKAEQTGNDIRGYPRAHHVEGDAAVFVTTHGLFSLSADGVVKEEIELPLRLVYPTSIARVRSGSYYVGMRHYVLRLTRRADRWERQWLAPKDCRAFEIVAERCQCR